jgi:hypothetical protein
MRFNNRGWLIPPIDNTRFSGEIYSGCENNVPLFRVGLSANILFIRCLMPDSGYQIQDHGIARAAQALAPRVALSFYIRANILVFNLNPESLVCLKRNEILKIAITGNDDWYSALEVQHSTVYCC